MRMRKARQKSSLVARQFVKVKTYHSVVFLAERWHKGGYDHVIGTSENGSSSIDSLSYTYPNFEDNGCELANERRPIIYVFF